MGKNRYGYMIRMGDEIELTEEQGIFLLAESEHEDEELPTTTAQIKGRS